MSEKLLPCPFCGSSDLAVMEILSRGLRIECEGCGAYSPVIKDGPALLTAWNTRAAMTCPLCDGTGYKDHAGFAMDPCDHKEYEMTLKIGNKVQKVKGYRWPGVVVAVFKTLAGKTRVVVECTVPEVAGALHIYSLEQVEVVDE